MNLRVVIWLSVLLIHIFYSPFETIVPHRYNKSDPYFDSYKEFFQNESGLYGETVISIWQIPIQFNTEESNTLGACYYYPDSHREITINTVHWFSITEIQRLSLLFHELGHCALDLNGHNDEVVEGLPVTIMSTYQSSSDLFIDYYDEYMMELFAGNTTAIKERLLNRVVEFRYLYETRESKKKLLLERFQRHVSVH